MIFNEVKTDECKVTPPIPSVTDNDAEEWDAYRKANETFAEVRLSSHHLLHKGEGGLAAL